MPDPTIRTSTGCIRSLYYRDGYYLITDINSTLSTIKTGIKKYKITDVSEIKNRIKKNLLKLANTELSYCNAESVPRSHLTSFLKLVPDKIDALAGGIAKNINKPTPLWLYDLLEDVSSGVKELQYIKHFLGAQKPKVNIQAFKAKHTSNPKSRFPSKTFPEGKTVKGKDSYRTYRKLKSILKAPTKKIPSKTFITSQEIILKTIQKAVTKFGSVVFKIIR